MVSSQAFSIALRDEPFVFLLGSDEKFGHLCSHRSNGSFINPHLVTVKWFRILTASPSVFPNVNFSFESQEYKSGC